MILELYLEGIFVNMAQTTATATQTTSSISKQQFESLYIEWLKMTEGTPEYKVREKELFRIALSR